MRSRTAGPPPRGDIRAGASRVIDLHLHTTASDGVLSPATLVSRAHAAGLTTISVTDHDTVGGLAEAVRAAAALGIRVVPGIEITAVETERDVHILGYFFDPDSEPLSAFLRAQRADRVRRVREMVDRLATLGFRLDVDAVLANTGASGRSVGRPAIADALVASGHVASRDEAFARLLGRGCPAFVPRSGVGSGEVIRVIQAAGGLASLAHPGVLDDDGLIPNMVRAGLDALEVWHSDHQRRHEDHYSHLAARFGLARTGGSDFHGEGVHRVCRIGTVTVPPRAFAALEARVKRS